MQKDRDVHTYIDESGTFAIPKRTGPSVSCVGAVIVPDASHDAIMRDFLALAKAWPRAANGEIKGRLLNENQFYDAIELLAGHGVLFDCIMMDVGLHEARDAEQQRDVYAARVRAAGTLRHRPSLIAQVQAIANDIRALTPQQYMQLVAMTELVAAVLSTKVLYFAQSQPREIGAFHWRIDAKGQKLTTAERIWDTLLPSMLESRSMREPDIHLIGADYSHYERFMVASSREDLNARRAAYGAPALPPDVEPGTATDINKVMREHFEFGDSVQHIGLQIADVVTSIAARAGRGHVRKRAWWHFGQVDAAAVAAKRSHTSHSDASAQ